MQGNIVSEEFVIKTLKYRKSDFLPLNDRERNGGIGMDGGTIIPEGAILLTWYSASSPKVFRDMRFLVSPFSNFDLVIGARAIQKHGICSAPNLQDVAVVRKHLSPEGEKSDKFSNTRACC